MVVEGKRGVRSSWASECEVGDEARAAEKAARQLLRRVVASKIATISHLARKYFHYGDHPMQLSSILPESFDHHCSP